MAFATGRYMKHKAFRYGNYVEYVIDFVRALYDDRIEFTDGDGEVTRGITVHRVGGHTQGMQIVRVWTRRGWMVLASDAVHFLANMEIPNPYPAVFHVGEMLDGFQRVRDLAVRPISSSRGTTLLSSNAVPQLATSCGASWRGSIRSAGRVLVTVRQEIHAGVCYQ